MRKIFSLAFCALLLALVAVPAAADVWDKKTTITFSQPVEVPGMVLPAGTYVFKLADSSSDRHIVLIYNAQETRLMTMVLAINNYRLFPKGKQVLTFEERRTDAPEALRAWFYGGDQWGQEFVYPKTRAIALAAAANVPVLSAEVEQAGQPEELIGLPVEAAVPENREIEQAELTPFENPEPAALNDEAAVEPAAAAIAEAAPAAEALPQTATPLPLIALLGASALALGGLLRLRVRHSG